MCTTVALVICVCAVVLSWMDVLLWCWVINVCELVWLLCCCVVVMLCDVVGCCVMLDDVM